MKKRNPERIIKLYRWLWSRAVKHRVQLFLGRETNTLPLTERCLLLLAPSMSAIQQLLKSPAFHRAVEEIIHSN